MESPILKSLGQINNLPALPAVVSQLQHAFADPATDVKTIATIIERDPAIATLVIKMANSSFFGFSQPIGTIQQAIMVLGLNVIKNVTTGVAIVKCFVSTGKRYSFDSHQFWLHSLGCAIGSKCIAEQLKEPNSDEYFLTGLLHDIGLLVLEQFFHEEFNEICEYCRTFKDDGYLTAERKILGGITHADIGAYLVKSWKLPVFLHETILHHHASPQQRSAHPENFPRVQVIMTADSRTFASGIGRFLDCFALEHDPGLSDELGLSGAVLDAAFVKVSQTVKELARLWGV